MHQILLVIKKTKTQTTKTLSYLQKSLLFFLRNTIFKIDYLKILITVKHQVLYENNN